MNWACPVPKSPVQPEGRLPVGTTCCFPPIYVFRRLTETQTKAWLKGCLHGDLSARKPQAGTLKGLGWHPPGSLQAAPAAPRRVGPTCPRAWQAARPRAKPRARGRLQRVAAFGRVPEARQVYGVPAASTVVRDPPVLAKEGRPGTWQGNTARVAERCSSSRKRGRLVTSSKRAFARGFG